VCGRALPFTCKENSGPVLRCVTHAALTPYGTI
jgi:hypothetical protein